MAGIGFSVNYDTKAGNGLGPRTVIVSAAKGTGDISQANLNALVAALGNAGGSGSGSDTNGLDAFTVAGISGTAGTDPIYLALQGTGTVGTSSGDYVSDITLTVVATFDQAAPGNP